LSIRRAAHLEQKAKTVTTSSPHRPLLASRDVPRFLQPGVALRVEGAAILAGGVVLFAHTDASWWLFGLLFLAPDLGLLGYLAGTRMGAMAYNATHALAIPAVLGLGAHVTGGEALVSLALVWIAHIGFDRTLGYGLKYATDFHDTHLQRVA
jgi:hypothetical protein